MAEQKTIAGAITVVTVENPEGYRIDLSSNIVHFKIGQTIDPTSVVAKCYETVKPNGTRLKSVRWNLVDGNGISHPQAGTSSQITITDLGNWVYPILVKAYGSVSLDESSLLVTATIQRVVDPSEYSLNPSAITVVYDESTSSYAPFDVRFVLNMNSAITGASTKKGYWKITDANGTVKWTGGYSDEYTISNNNLQQAKAENIFPLKANAYESLDDSIPLAQATVSFVTQPAPTPSTNIVFKPSIQLYDADSSGKAVSTAEYPVLYTMYIGNDVVTPSSVATALEGTDIDGISIPSQPSVAGCGLRVNIGKSPNCNLKVVLTATKDNNTYTATGYLPIAPLKQGPQGGTVGSLSKMYYYAGVYARNKRYDLTETQAPYVMYDDQFFMLDNAANGGASGHWTNVTPTDGGNPWTLMASEMKYYIAEALFAKFAKLGSAIFNEDYQLSQYGSFLGYGGAEYPIHSSGYYQYADENNMLGEVDSYLHRSTGISTVSNADFNSNIKRFDITLQDYTQKYYILEIQCDADEHRQVNIDLEQHINDYYQPVYATISDSEKHVYRFSVPNAGEWHLYYRRVGSMVTDAPKIIYSMVSDCAFRPNMFVDYLQGLLYSNKGIFDEGTFRKGTFTDMTAVRGTFTDMQAIRGYFNDITVEGKINNLITVIDWDNNIGRDKIITAYYQSTQGNDFDYRYTQTGLYTNKRYYLDLLNCGDYVVIKSLPEYGQQIYYRVPYYHNAGNDGQGNYYYDRGHTRDSSGNASIMSSDDMRRLVGRRITIKMNIPEETANLYQTRFSGIFEYKLANKVYQEYATINVSGSTVSSLATSINKQFDYSPASGSNPAGWGYQLQNQIEPLEMQSRHTANGQSFFLWSTLDQDKPRNMSFSMLPQTIHIECKIITFLNQSSGGSSNLYYGYGWTGSSIMEITQGTPDPDTIDETWE